MFATVEESIKQQRLEICSTCEHYSLKLNSCKKCGCYLPAKTAFAKTTCPVGKWQESQSGSGLVSKLEESLLNLWDK